MRKLSIIAVSIGMFMTSQAHAVDCSRAKEKLSINYFRGHSELIGVGKIDEALAATYDALEYLQCISVYPDETIEAVEWAAGNLGMIYKDQRMPEVKVLSLYDKKIGKKIKNASVELNLFYRFLKFYSGAHYTEYGWRTERKDNICTFTMDWGSLYHGCNKVHRVSNSPLASVSKMNDMSLAKALINVAYVNADKNPECYEKQVSIESLYGFFPMMLAENRVMKIAEIAPLMSKALLEKALLLDADFNQLAAICKNQKKSK